MEPAGRQATAQASAPTDLPRTDTCNISPSLSETSQGGSESNPATDLVEMLRQVVPQSTEKPQEILRLCQIGGGLRFTASRGQTVYHQDFAFSVGEFAQVSRSLPTTGS